MKIGRAISSAMKTAGSKLVNGLSYTASAVGRFLYRNWKFIVAGALALVAFAAVTAAIVFFWPAVIGAIGAIGFTLPIVGAAVSFGFLNTLAIPAAAAVIGAVAAGAAFAASLVVMAGIWAVNKIDGFMQKKGAAPIPREYDDEGHDDLGFDSEEGEPEDAPSCLSTLCKRGRHERSEELREGSHSSSYGSPISRSGSRRIDLEKHDDTLEDGYDSKVIHV